MNSSQKEKRCKANQRKGRCLKRLLLFRIVLQQKQLCSCFLDFQTGERHVEGFQGSRPISTWCAEWDNRDAVVAGGNQDQAGLRIGDSEVLMLQATQVTCLHSETPLGCVYVDTQTPGCQSSSAFHRPKESQKQKTWVSLEVQCIRICLSMQEGETGSIPSLGRFHSCEAAKCMHHSYWACPIEPRATHAEPRSPSYWSPGG